MIKRIIFFHPKALNFDSDRPSDIRPIKLIRTFEKLGYVVDLATGESRERKKSQQEILKNIRNNTAYDFLYGETSNKPNALGDADNLPRGPVSDYLFLKKVHTAGIPIGIFYRDIYWYFPLFKSLLPRYQRWLSLPLYWLDWFCYRSVINHLFLPSLEMNQKLPHPYKTDMVSELPPGLETAQTEPVTTKEYAKPNTLTCLYVGALLPPIYDLRETIKLLSQRKDVILKIICRKNDWDAVSDLYQETLSNNIMVEHISHNDIGSAYNTADLALIVREAHEYLDFCMPYKLFEALDYSTPLIVSGENTVSRFVKENNFGWEVTGLNEFEKLLTQITADRSLLFEKISSIAAGKKQHSWESRAHQIAQTLGNVGAESNEH